MMNKLCKKMDLILTSPYLQEGKAVIVGGRKLRLKIKSSALLPLWLLQSQILKRKWNKK